MNKTSPEVLGESAATWLAQSHFSLVDYAILGCVLVSSVVVGVLAGWRKSSSSTKVFLVGGRDMNPVAVCLSLLGGVVSSISIQGNSTEVYLHGTQIWLNLLGCVWGIIIVTFVILPVIYPLNLGSLCQYLEVRFNSRPLKKLASLTQILNNIMYLGVCLYAPSLTLSSALGVPTYVAVVVFGIACAIYVTLGGIRGVIYTDIIQTLMMFVGVFVVIVQVVSDLGGIPEVWGIAEKGGRIEFFNFDFSPLERHTFWSVQCLGFYFVVSTIGISQTQYQRLTSVSTLPTSQWLCVAFLVGVSILWSLFYFSGLVAYAAYVDCDPVTSRQVEKPDQILAYMVGDKLTHIPGMVGLFVSAVAGALLSSLSSFVNSTVVLLWEDIFSGWEFFSRMSHKTTMFLTRTLCCIIVVIAVGSAMIVEKFGTLFQAAYTISGSLLSPFDGLFVTSIAAPWVNVKGIISGFLAAMSFNIWLSMSRMANGAGSTEPLPLATDGCYPESGSFHEINSINGSHSDPFLLTSASNATIETSLRSPHDGQSYPAILDVSYCYIGLIGVIIVYVVSTIVSLITGVTKPSEVDQQLVSKTCFRIYSWLYSCLSPAQTDPPKTGVSPQTSPTAPAEDRPSKPGAQIEETVVKIPSYSKDSSCSL
ncbi:sodium-coupled monocarboxylate transporter 1-like [Macrobrachium rosenbergii]|uniref:sodium-coupled monocarboxylate transporter 1-like n=1 Tax=Macrobrachium rosenbergii TaxID=79674 RepID=UPI0034D51986